MRKHVVRSTGTLLALLAFGTAGLSGCASMNQKERGAIIGAGAGAALGGVIGNNTGGSTAKGAIIGAVVGGAAGAIIGHQMDQQAKEIKQNIPGADVNRVGEAILVTFDSGILFDFDSAALRGEARSNLQALANSLDKYPNTDILVVGHTDSKGAAAYNQRLSEQRARSAADYLVSHGVPRARLDVQGRGLTEPIASNDTEAGRQQNRRVEIAIIASEAFRNQARQQAGD
jgi:outer membrane protein OmpA-like peptidoglycan-associated protein